MQPAELLERYLIDLMRRMVGVKHALIREELIAIAKDEFEKNNYGWRDEMQIAEGMRKFTVMTGRLIDPDGVPTSFCGHGAICIDVRTGKILWAGCGRR